MGASSVSLFLVLISVWVSLISPVHSLTCLSQKLPSSKIKYTNCTDLCALNSTPHYSYDAANSSFSIAFVAVPPSYDDWVAWGINPTDTGMVGAQALIAHKSNGGVPVVRTYNLTSCGFINELKLSFDVWDLSAADSGGSMVILVTVRVPASAERLNQVWQVGQMADGLQSTHCLRQNHRH